MSIPDKIEQLGARRGPPMARGVQKKSEMNETCPVSMSRSEWWNTFLADELTRIQSEEQRNRAGLSK